MRNDLTNTNNVVTFKDNNIVLSDNIDGCDIKTSNILNDYWIQCGIDIDGSDNNDKSGYSVALSPNGKFLVVGSPFHDSNKGVTRVYKFELGNWTQIGNDINGGLVDDNLGFSVDINNDGDIIVVGSPYSNGSSGNNDCGIVQIYQYNSNGAGLYDFDPSDVETVTYTVTVAQDSLGNNYFAINGEAKPVITMKRGSTYIFDQSDSSNTGHPLIIKSDSL